ncbi:hypothetical protein JNK13_04455 [bacterium]|nr:hypothetical protein [bacterium]
MVVNAKERIKALKEFLKLNPGAQEFVELATLLAEDAQERSLAREYCFRGLAHHPNNFEGRLQLARLFYLDGMKEFCVRELRELRTRGVESPALDKLLELLGEGPAESSEQAASNAGHDQGKNEAGHAETRQATSPESVSKKPAAEKIVGEIDIDADFSDILDDLDK